MEGERDGFRIGKTFIRYDWIALALIVLFFLLRLQAAQTHNFWPDEGRESFDAIFLSKAPWDFINLPYAAHPPLFMYIEAIFFAIFGVSDFSARLVVPVIAMLITLLIYRIASRLFTKPAGIFALTLFSTSYLPFFMSTRVLTEIPMAFFYALTLFLFYMGFERPDERYRFWKWDIPYMHLAGAALGFSFLMKEAAIFLIPTVLLYTLLTRGNIKWLKRKDVWVALAIALVIFAPWAYRNQVKLGEPTGVLRYLWIGAGAGEDIPEYNLNYFYYLDAIPRVLDNPATLGLVTYLLLFAIVLLVANYRYKKSIFLLCWIFVFPALMSLGNMKEPRYLIPIFPAFFLAIGHLPELLRKSAKPLYSTAALTLIVIFLVATTYPASLQTIEQKGQGYYGLRETGLYLKDNVPDDKTVLTRSMMTISFYAQRPIGMPPGEEEDFIKQLPDIDYISIDSTEQTPSYLLPYIAGHPEVFPIEQVFAVETGHPLDQCPFYIINGKCLYGSLLLRVNHTS